MEVIRHPKALSQVTQRITENTCPPLRDSELALLHTMLSWVPTSLSLLKLKTKVFKSGSWTQPWWFLKIIESSHGRRDAYPICSAHQHLESNMPKLLDRCVSQRAACIMFPVLLMLKTGKLCSD